MNTVLMLLLDSQDRSCAHAVELQTRFTLGEYAHLICLLTVKPKNVTIRQSADHVASWIHKIMCKEGILQGAVYVKYELSANTPNDIDGGSAELALALGFATAVRPDSNRPPLAATGIVDKDSGHIRPIGGIEAKIRAALQQMLTGGQILYPKGNEGEISPALRQQAQEQKVQLISVAHLHEALPAIGIKLHRTVIEPFRGLEAYRYENSNIFYGRSAEVSSIVKEFQKKNRILLIVGASGSGKSSLIQAGVIPKIETNPDLLPSGHKLCWCILRPSEIIIANESSLWDQLADHCIKFSHSFNNQVSKPESSLTNAQAFITWMQNALHQFSDLSKKTIQYLWVIDQLEEIFTQVSTPKLWDDLVLVLQRLNIESGHWMLISMRNDFIPQYQGYEPLFTWLREKLYLVKNPNVEDIQQMILIPAQLAEYHYELQNGISLATRIYEDLGHDTAALPLLSFTLQQLYEKTKSSGKNVFTYATYNEIGGINGAIGKKADEVYAGLPKDVQDTLPRVIRTLTHINEQGTATARAALLSEFAADGPERKLIDAFIKEHLFVIDNKDNIQQSTMG